jgi:hypothetical protein
MEDVRSWYGFILYQSAAVHSPTGQVGFNPVTLHFDSLSVHDRVQVFVDQMDVGSACVSTICIA